MIQMKKSDPKFCCCIDIRCAGYICALTMYSSLVSSFLFFSPIKSAIRRMPPKPLPDALNASANGKDSRRDSLLKKVTSETGFGAGRGEFILCYFLLCLFCNLKVLEILQVKHPIHGPAFAWVFHSLSMCFTNICHNIFILDDTSEGSDYSEENESQEEEDNSRPRAVDLKLPKLVFTDEVEGAGFKSAVSFSGATMHMLFHFISEYHSVC